MNCPYCKGRNLIPATYAKVENIGYSPCRCIENADRASERKDKVEEEVKASHAKQTMTVFIDESLHDNPWIKWDASLPKKQASYSYIICRGALKSEQEITEMNEISRNSCSANEAKSIIFSVIEAISSVLLKLAFQYHFQGEVIIYTDNMVAKDI